MALLKKYWYVIIGFGIIALVYWYKNRNTAAIPKPTLFAQAQAKPLTVEESASIAGKKMFFQPGVVFDENDPATWPIWQ